MSGFEPIRFEEVERWLFDVALPFWARAGVDQENGGFVEHLTLEGRDARSPFKRMRAQARQVYCFSHAAVLGWQAPGIDPAEHGWRFMCAHGRRDDGAWVRSMGRAGGVVDSTCDAYDMAFVLLAHAWRYRAVRNPRLLESADTTIASHLRLLRHPNGLGWLAAEGDLGPRQQNPHMHLMEAAIELAAVSANRVYVEVAQEIASLLSHRWLDHRTGSLVECYNADWSRATNLGGVRVEPGHQFEWVWILYRAQRVLGIDLRAEARMLYAFARQFGIDRTTGLTYDAVSAEGVVQSASSRLWPQTEALKAHLAILEHEEEDHRSEIAACVSNILDRYLKPAPPGAWFDQLNADGQLDTDKIPSTSLYHLMLAFTELLRLRGAIEAFGDTGIEAVRVVRPRSG